MSLEYQSVTRVSEYVSVSAYRPVASRTLTEARGAQMIIVILDRGADVNDRVPDGRCAALIHTD